VPQPHVLFHARVQDQADLVAALLREEGPKAPHACAELVEREALRVENVGAGGVEGGSWKDRKGGERDGGKGEGERRLRMRDRRRSLAGFWE